MNLDFLQYIVPVILFVGWIIAIIQSNTTNGVLPRVPNIIIMIIFTIGYVIFLIGCIATELVWLKSLGSFVITTTSLLMATHYFNKKDRTGILYFGSLGVFCLIYFLANI